MDTAAFNHISLCSGYGGIDLGLSRAMGGSLRTIAYSEIEAFACANLVSKMEAGLLDPAPIWTDLKTFPWEEFHGLVDIISGGYPCQPFSAAGKRAGKEDARHLWPWIADGIAAVRPQLCFFENVEGHVTLGLRDVIKDLGRMGYRTTWGVFSASEVGAPHQRKRVFILAHREGEGLQRHNELLVRRNESRRHTSQQEGQVDGRNSASDVWPSRPGELADNTGQTSIRLPERTKPPLAEPRFDGETIWPSRPGEPQHGWEPPRVVANSRRGQHGRGKVREGAVGNASGEFGKADEPLGDAKSRQDNGRESPRVVGNERRKLDNASGNGHGTDDSVSTRRESAVDASVLGDATGERPTPQRPEPKGQQRETSIASASDAGCVDHTAMPRQQAQRDECVTERRAGSVGESSQRQAQPSLGGNLHGSADRLDHAQLYVACDNRTDELRLLGNGVVPATAERAFLTLLTELQVV